MTGSEWSVDGTPTSGGPNDAPAAGASQRARIAAPVTIRTHEPYRRRRPRPSSFSTVRPRTPGCSSRRTGRSLTTSYTPTVPDRLDRVQIPVAGDVVEIRRNERDTLLEKLRTADGGVRVIERFEAAEPGRPVQLDDEQRSCLRHLLELWGVSVLPEGLARLLIALVRADPRG